jgi:hypothetical protein
MGPSAPDEVIHEFPTNRYIVGRLAPARSSEYDSDAAIPSSENDALGVGSGNSEEGDDDTTPPLIIGFNPSSFGLSFLIDARLTELKVEISWGDYRREKGEADKGFGWRRYDRKGVVEGVPVGAIGKIPRIALSSAPSAANPAGVRVLDIDDLEIVLEGVVHEFSGYRAVSLFLVNRRTKGDLNDRSKDERWIFQPRLFVTASSTAPSFVAKDFRADQLSSDDDGEAATNALLYRHSREFATGHGVAAGWNPPAAEGYLTSAVFTEFIPQSEVPQLIAPGERTGGAVLDMKLLAEAGSGEQLMKYLEPMVGEYESWIAALERASRDADIENDPQLKDAARENVSRCKECANRIRFGLNLLLRDTQAFEAFRFANFTMWDQRVHSLWAAANRKKGALSGELSTFDKPGNRTWRPFQMGFILLNLCGLSDEESEDRRRVDLLWFPTGGGKTEAYLGLSAFTIALRRLRGDRHGMHGGAGVSIIMRYTLRLLTVQQFQRAAALICACELVRRRDPRKWGNEPIRIGVWVGSGTTPNTFADSQKVLEEINDGKRPRSGSPVQLVSCPRCGTNLVDHKGSPLNDTYVVDRAVQRTLIWCRNDECDFNATLSNKQGLPVVVVDDELYRTCPSLVVATVDKFARIPFKGEARALFGLRDRHSTTYGHISAAHGDKVGGKKLSDAHPVARLLPPELIIQDELHLISGPLGTMVGLYETIVDFATSIQEAGSVRIGAKIISSTATIRRAAQQTHQLYGGRRLSIFPPSGLTASDSFFARELEIDPDRDANAGRLYVGINAPGSSTKTLLVRVYAVLLAAAEAELLSDPVASDPYGTLVGYFNSLRALGGAKRLVEDDVHIRLKYLSKQRGLTSRRIFEPRELTSRINSSDIPSLLKRLDVAFPRGSSDYPVDVLLATNMISVGVDIDRLGLMVVTGQPKTTAEYIQATSRVGRKFPGLVVTMYNWMGARDLSHYERFTSYHSALYRYVEAISVTPFSSRALDRGLRGIFAGLVRLFGERMASETSAQNFESTSNVTKEVIREIVDRAALLVGKENAGLVETRLLSHRDEWARYTEGLLMYGWLDDSRKPTNNSRVLLRTSGTDNEGEWATPGSLREVESTAAFFLDEGDVP